MSNSSEILATLAMELFERTPRPVDYCGLVAAQICPEIIEAIRRLEVDSQKVITGADITHYQTFGGRDHCDPTLSESPIRTERQCQGPKLR